MSILVVGAGATGGYFGAKLAQAGRDVTFLVRPRRAEQLRERGLRIVGQGADQVVIPRLVTAGQLAGRADIVLVAVKATALEAAVADFAPAVGPRTLVIPFLNGMSHLATLNARFGEQAVLGGVVLVATQLSGEGDVVELAPSASVQIGAQGGSRTDRVQAAYDELSGAGFDLSISDDIVAEMWHKVGIHRDGRRADLPDERDRRRDRRRAGRSRARPRDARRGQRRLRRGRLPGPWPQDRGHHPGHHPGRVTTDILNVS